MKKTEHSPGRDPAGLTQGNAVRQKLATVATSTVPWLIIGGLLWAGLFIKPQPVGTTVTPPVVEKRDHYYGITAPSADKLWIAGSSGKIIALGRDGQAERLATPSERNLQDIANWDAMHAVAVGNDGVVLASENSGKTWIAATDVPRSQVANKLNRVRVAAQGIAVAAGEMGALLGSRDYGKTWTRLRPEEDVAWNDVALLAEGRMIAVGEFGRIAASDDGGANWKDVKGPVQTSLMAISFRDNKLGIAVGLEGVVLATRDGGHSWHTLPAKAHDHLFDIAWDETRQRWVGTGSLGRWMTIESDAATLNTGRLDERDLSWHTRVLPTAERVWFTGANVGHWDGKHWQALGDAWQPTTLMNLPIPAKKTP